MRPPSTTCNDCCVRGGMLADLCFSDLVLYLLD
jgi:hypothetical protein